MEIIDKAFMSSGVEGNHSVPAWTPANKTDTLAAKAGSASATPPDAVVSQQSTASLKKRREERERSRVSRACDRCKKYVISLDFECMCYGRSLTLAQKEDEMYWKMPVYSLPESWPTLSIHRLIYQRTITINHHR
jgi:hypothetical protein